MKYIIYTAESRGHANHGWLDSNHTFSFANYYNPDRLRFGLLRVLNDDIIAGGAGFPTHPHNNMEIISVPIYGALEHKDSMGNTSVIHEQEVQVMSAGLGVLHSEFNHYADKDANFLQIWIYPKEFNIQPRYDQAQFDIAPDKDSLTLLVSPDGTEGSLVINQDAWIYKAIKSKGGKFEYKLHDSQNGVYLFVITGGMSLESDELARRDGIGIWDTERIDIDVIEDSTILILEVPMKN